VKGKRVVTAAAYVEAVDELLLNLSILRPGRTRAVSSAGSGSWTRGEGGSR
jgi:hypothetical protein